MKFIFALSLLLITESFAKMGLAPCPIPTFMTFSDYQTAYPSTGPSAVYSHKHIYGDKGF
jgi:hypothetical protein